MGNKQGKRKKYELCEIQYEKEFELKPPWQELIIWALEDLNASLNIAIIKNIIEEIKDITASEESFFNITEGHCIGGFMFDNKYVTWASFLLTEIKSLKKVRYYIVPKLISEDEFWLKYFSTIKMIIVKHAFESKKQ
ncbi:BSD-domain protein, putative [Plasmodium chabaudi adami]|uniref:BSD-domain protein, putative n=1 Tax=Plasmodium chabaudi adami TaxID=5826 RepID=A0A1D3LHZ5_PLACE|nr:BSD-domain protein, putative [Plasmodium chabaudi adami]